MTTTAQSTTPALEQLTGTWVVDQSHSTFGFSARHAMVATVRGDFAEWSATLHLDGANPTNSSAEAEVSVASIRTGNEMRDNHLRSNDFLEIETYPTITFRSTRVEAGGDGESFTLTGDLTIKGVTREVSLDVELLGIATDAYGNQRAGFTGTTTINRKDFGVSWNVALETGGVMVSDKIKLQLDISAIKQA